MKLTGEPAPSTERFAEALLLHATMHGVSELRLARGPEQMGVRFDGETSPQTEPEAAIFGPVTEAALRFAEVRTWPWTRRVAGKRLDVEFPRSGQRSGWRIESGDIRSELTLTRMRDRDDGTQADG